MVLLSFIQDGVALLTYFNLLDNFGLNDSSKGQGAEQLRKKGGYGVRKKGDMVLTGSDVK